MQKRSQGIPRILAIALLFASLAGLPAVGQGDRDRFLTQLSDVRDEILRLQAELKRLGGRERGIEQELQVLRTDLQLRQAEYGEVRLRSERVHEDLSAAEARLTELGVSQTERNDYLSARLRQIYLDGSDAGLRRLLGRSELDDRAAGSRYASFLNEQDARILRDFRAEAARLDRERTRLKTAQEELQQVEAEMSAARDRLKTSERNRSQRLRSIRSDKQRRRIALEELSQTASILADRIENIGKGSEVADLDVRKFKGLLDWPTAGRTTTGFGTQVHPRFKTQLPHPGLDLAGASGADIVSVFDGSVVYASWMRGYGLTVIVDHGSQILSIYAHASVLMVEQGEKIRRGQLIGKVGETGSLQGPFLYFEMRDGGSPVDPKSWLRRR